MGWFQKLFGRREASIGGEAKAAQLQPFVRAGAGRYGWLRHTAPGYTGDMIIPLDGDRVVLGATPERYPLPGAQAVTLLMAGVSKLHALLTMTEEGYEIVDLQSTCGTTVNDHRVVRHTLQDGDYLRIGEATLQLVYLRTSVFARDRPGRLPPRGVPVGAVRGPQCDSCESTRCEVKKLEKTCG